MDPDTKDIVSRLEGSISRLDSKVDKLVEAMNRLARIEEKHLALSQTTERHEVWLKNHEDRIRGVEGDSILAGAGISANSKLVWALIGAIGLVVGMVIKSFL